MPRTGSALDNRLYGWERRRDPWRSSLRSLVRKGRNIGSGLGVRRPWLASASLPIRPARDRSAGRDRHSSFTEAPKGDVHRESRMTSFGRHSITHLGTLHGEGTLLVQDGRQLGQVTYEIDGYVDNGGRSANGQIEAESRILHEAFCAEDATIVLESGRCIRVMVSDPQGGATAEISVRGGFPL